MRPVHGGVTGPALVLSALLTYLSGREMQCRPEG